MKKLRTPVFWVYVLAVCSICTISAGADGDYYFNLAQIQESNNYFQKARRSYSRAASHYLQENQLEKLKLANAGWYRVKCVLDDYIFSPLWFKSKIKRVYPWASKEDIGRWLETMPLLAKKIDGNLKYQANEIDNLRYRNQDIMDDFIEYYNNPLALLVGSLLDNYVKADYSDYNVPYDRPIDILSDFQLIIKKNRIPKTGDGIVRIWFPIPIQTACQDSIVVISLEPSAYIVQQPVNADIGICYFEVPVSSITGDLEIRSQVRFKHYQQRLIIDPPLIGPYDTGSDLYKTYTAATLNTAITPAITAKAKEIVGAETNPYLQAKLLFDYIVANIDYSFPPYGTVDACNIPVSTFTLENQFGDCGYQSVLFCALARSLGIPARSPGGYQLFSDIPDSHFWAEFYLPAPYNCWIPADTTIAEMYKEVSGFANSDLDLFKEYYFSQQDPLRMVIQNDVDINLSPLPGNTNIYFKIVFQDPVVQLNGSNRIFAELANNMTSYFYCYKNFNYDNAVTASAGEEIELNAEDFGLDLFDIKTRFSLRDNYLGKILTFKLNIKEFNSQNTSVTLLVPDNLPKIAYKIICQVDRENEKSSTRWALIK